MSEIPELREQLGRCIAEISQLRAEIPPAERGQHERLQSLRLKGRALRERIDKLREERRATRAEVREYADYCRAVAAGKRTADPRVLEQLRDAVVEQGPQRPDDPRLSGWYHTIQLRNGLGSDGRFDLRPTVADYGLPASLRGRTALDVGTADGFWAFELESRGADRVVAVDIERYGQFDLLPSVRASMTERVLENRMDDRFWLAHAYRGSTVEHRLSSVYELTPDLAGTFDVVFCGSLLMHLTNPLKALVNIRSVTNEMAVIATLFSPEIERAAPDKPWIAFGQRGPDLDPKVHPRNPRLGASAVYWHMSTHALREMMEYAGFERTEPAALVPLAPAENLLTVVHGYSKGV